MVYKFAFFLYNRANFKGVLGGFMESVKKLFQYESLEQEYQYISQHFLSDVKMVSGFEKVENGLYHKCTVLWNHKEYYLFQYSPNKILLIPKDLDSVQDTFGNVVLFSINGKGLHYSTLKKDGDYLNSISYDFCIEDLDTNSVTLLKRTSSYFVDSNELQKKYKERNNPELFFLNKEYLDIKNKYLEKNDGIKFCRTPEKTMAYTENYIDILNALRKYLHGENYISISDNQSSLIALADHFQMNYSK